MPWWRGVMMAAARPPKKIKYEIHSIGARKIVTVGLHIADILELEKRELILQYKKHPYLKAEILFAAASKSKKNGFIILNNDPRLIRQYWRMDEPIDLGTVNYITAQSIDTAKSENLDERLKLGYGDSMFHVWCGYEGGFEKGLEFHASFWK